VALALAVLDDLLDLGLVDVAALDPVGFEAFAGRNSMSPSPTSFSAPPWSRIVRLSACVAIASAIRDGTFALMSPVTTSTDGRWVATMRWMPTARAICAIRTMCASTSRGATIMRSASSSMTNRMYGSSSHVGVRPAGVAPAPCGSGPSRPLGAASL
jgi:hypothetical protein